MSNPFSPTPLGRDWTPPQPPEPAYEDEQENALGDLFADEPSTTNPVSSTAAASGLGDLFTDEDPDGSRGGLADLFPAEETTEPAADTPAADTPAADMPVGEHPPAAVRPRIRKRGLVGVGNIAAPMPATQTPPTATPAVESGPLTDQTVVGDAASSPAPTERATPDVEDPAATEQNTAPQDIPRQDVPQPDVPQPDVSQPAPGAATTPAPRRGALLDTPTTEVAKSGTARPAHPGTREKREERRGRRDQDNERIWTLVDQTLALIGTDSNLQKIAQDLELTQDPDTYRRQRAELESALRPRMGNAGITIGGTSDIEKIIDRVHDELTGISILGELWRDPKVDEILVDRWDIVNVERSGHLEMTELSFRDPRHAEMTARALALKVSDRAVSRSIPLVTAELPGARITFAFGAVVKGGLSITIRKFKKLLELTDLLGFGSLNEEMVEFLSDAVRARASILVSGGTGTGKTTIINLLSTFIPDDERVITIEDAFELKLANTHVVSLQTKEASSSDDIVSVNLANLLRNTLRMRPDRIIVGEIREGEGAMVMLAAANTGHDGTITTIHANSVDAALNERLPDLVRQSRSNRDDLAIQRSIAGAFDLAVQVTRGRNGGRFISEIALIRGLDDHGQIVTDTIFSGEDKESGVHFVREGIRAETEFTRRLTEQGGGRWTN